MSLNKESNPNVMYEVMYSTERSRVELAPKIIQSTAC